MNPSRRHSTSDSALQHREGIVYVAVLFTALLVTTLVATAVSLNTTSIQRESDRANKSRAMRIAESEMHRVASLMRTNSLWRTSLTNGTYSSWRNWSAGNSAISGLSQQVRHQFIDADGLLDDDFTDDVELTVHARVGLAEYAVTSKLVWDPAPLSILKYAVTATNQLNFENGAISSEHPIQVGGDCTETSGGIVVAPRLECSGDIPMTVRGDEGESNVEVPTRDLVATYTSTSTAIPATGIRQGAGARYLDEKLLSPTANPFGTPNGDGRYAITMDQQKLVISNCRINATLVIEGATEIEIRGAVVWTCPAEPDAILITDAPVRFIAIENELDENALAINFNPAASPYRSSWANNTTTDRFPSEFRGLIYSTSDVVFEPTASGDNLKITGMMTARSITISGLVSFFAFDEMVANPPLELCDPVPMQFESGSWRRTESPR
ncbi:hypothetical protein [Rubripirellula reticaptiva]|uniref:Type 4 fimbrial biogenesis protein PilX N-terminal domain-containing protein n=1 Tax=Rubripirellula reticaptiva TaxID=2528013 RepID=A0A5C6EP53_9BACT|nr:hypothetical protein [Rubripirellula reticaptiva]TWU49396.1 hypothetical protein Poly59_40110 [Rubripirellula reticaptiva]